jgi:hypothetical protein
MVCLTYPVLPLLMGVRYKCVYAREVGFVEEKVLTRAKPQAWHQQVGHVFIEFNDFRILRAIVSQYCTLRSTPCWCLGGQRFRSLDFSF